MRQLICGAGQARWGAPFAHPVSGRGSSSLQLSSWEPLQTHGLEAHVYGHTALPCTGIPTEIGSSSASLSSALYMHESFDVASATLCVRMFRRMCYVYAYVHV